MEEVAYDRCRHRLDAGVDRARAADDPRAGVLLRRAGAVEERAQHDDDERGRARLRRRGLGARSATRCRSRPGTPIVGGVSSSRCCAASGLEAQGTIPHLLFMAYQGTFAIITAALVSGAIVERMRFAAYLAFLTLWSLVVYAPVAHWVWGGGWLAQAGRARLRGRHGRARERRRPPRWWRRSCSGPRKDYARQAILPHNVPFTVLGAGLLWFGWFGFNAGSALAANGAAALAFVNTCWPRRDARGLDAARPRRAPARRPRWARPPASWSAWWRSRPRRASWARWRRMALGARGGRPQLLRAALARAHAARRLARRGGRARRWAARWARCSPACLASKAWNGAADGLLFGNPQPARHPGRRRPGGARLQRGRDGRHPQADRRS